MGVSDMRVISRKNKKTGILAILFAVLLLNPQHRFKAASVDDLPSKMRFNVDPVDLRDSRGQIRISPLCQSIEPVGRILEDADRYIWGCSAIEGPDGRVHIFFASWTGNFQNRLFNSEIIHAVAQKPEGPYEVVGTVLKGSQGTHFDASSVFNPTIHKVGEKYALLYTGSNTAGTDYGDPENHPASTQRIGLAIADSLDGPFLRVTDQPILEMSYYKDDWDNCLVTNPALIQHPDGQFWLYYTACGKRDRDQRKIGLAVADNIEGPYSKHPDNPLVDFSHLGKQIEDAYVYRSNGYFYMLLADNMGPVVKMQGGLLLKSRDGINFSGAALGYDTTDVYFGGLVQQFERPQILMRNGKPAYIFLAMTGGANRKPTPSILKINQQKYEELIKRNSY